MSLDLTLPDDWRTWDEPSKERLLARLRAEAIISGSVGHFCTHETPSAMARHYLGERWHHRNYHDVLDQLALDMDAGQCQRATESQPSQTGKALALDTPIATPYGWSTMGELCVGDQIFDDQGRPCTVTNVSPVWTDRECYEVITGDGERIIASGEHEWRANLDSRQPYRIYETTVLAKPRGTNARIATCPGLDLPDTDLPMDPYTFGAWLGDGHTYQNRLTSMDTEIIDRIREAGYEAEPIKGNADRGRAKTYRLFTKDDTRWQTRFITEIKSAIGGSQTGREKFIPEVYFRSSRAQRLALLQGLIDTDGHVDPTRALVEFVTISEILAENVRELVFTLGAKATVSKGRATINGIDCGPKYRVHFMLADAAWIPRKRSRCRDSSVAGVRYVKARKVETVPTVCIEVDSPSHMFLAGRTLLPTHNSTWVNWFVIWWMARHPQDPIIRMSYAADLATSHGMVVRRWVEEHGGTYGLLPTRGTWAQNNWTTRTGAGLRSGGMLTGVSGYPAAMMIIDDMYAGRAEADSKTIRDRTYAEYSGSLLTRLRPDSPLLIVNTRWHEKDINAEVVKLEGNERDGGRWRVLNFAALAREDDPLGRRVGEPLQHPWIDPDDTQRALEHWQEKRRTSTLRDWNSIYQGDPQPAEGALLNGEQIAAATVFGELPEAIKTGVAIDPSGGGRDEAGIVGGQLDADGIVTWTHDRSGRMPTEQWARVGCLLAYEIEANEIVVERTYGGDSAKLILRTTWDVLTQEGLVEGPCPRIVEVHAKKGKRVRAEPIAAQVILGKVKFHALAVLDVASEWQTWQEESTESPGRIDASSYLAYRWLKIPGSESVVSTIASDATPKQPTGQGELARIRVARPVGGR
jgi:hypothetical protein